MHTAWPAKTVLKLIFPRGKWLQRCDHDDLVVEGIVDVRQSGERMRGGVIDFAGHFLSRASCGRSLLKTFRNLSKRACCCRKLAPAGLVASQSQMHPFVTAILHFIVASSLHHDLVFVFVFVFLFRFTGRFSRIFDPACEEQVTDEVVEFMR